MWTDVLHHLSLLPVHPSRDPIVGASCGRLHDIVAHATRKSILSHGYMAKANWRKSSLQSFTLEYLTCLLPSLKGQYAKKYVDSISPFIPILIHSFQYLSDNIAAVMLFLIFYHYMLALFAFFRPMLC